MSVEYLAWRQTYPCSLVRMHNDVDRGGDDVTALVDVPDDERRFRRHFERHQLVERLQTRLAHVHQLRRQDLT